MNGKLADKLLRKSLAAGDAPPRPRTRSPLLYHLSYLAEEPGFIEGAGTSAKSPATAVRVQAHPPINAARRG